MTVEDRVTSALIDYLDGNRPAGFPAASALPIRDDASELARPLPIVSVGVETSEEMLPLRGTYRIEGVVDLISQPKETSTADHRDWTGCLAALLHAADDVRAWINAPRPDRPEEELHLYDIYVGGGDTTHDGDHVVSSIPWSIVAVGRRR